MLSFNTLLNICIHILLFVFYLISHRSILLSISLLRILCYLGSIGSLTAASLNHVSITTFEGGLRRCCLRLLSCWIRRRGRNWGRLRNSRLSKIICLCSRILLIGLDSYRSLSMSGLLTTFFTRSTFFIKIQASISQTCLTKVKPVVSIILIWPPN